MASEKTGTKRVRIDEVLLEQIDWYDFFPKGMWSRQARVNYCVSVGLGVLGLPLFLVPVVMRVYHTYSPCLEEGGA